MEDTWKDKILDACIVFLVFISLKRCAVIVILYDLKIPLALTETSVLASCVCVFSPIYMCIL